MENLKKKRTDQGPYTGGSLASEQISGGLRAKRGKAGGGLGAPKSSNLAEQAARSQGRAAMATQSLMGRMASTGAEQSAGQVKQKGDIQRKQLASQAKQTRANIGLAEQQQAMELQSAKMGAAKKRASSERMKIRQVNAAADQRIDALVAEKDLMIDDLFDQFARSEKELEFRRDGANIEQLGHELALRDRTYLDELSRIGRERELQDNLNFVEESRRLILGNEVDSLIEELDWRRAFDAKERDFNYKIKNMSFNDAYKVFEAETKAANQKAMWEGGVSVASSAGQMYTQQQEDEANQKRHDEMMSLYS
jgi:hypothetical protein